MISSDGSEICYSQDSRAALIQGGFAFGPTLTNALRIVVDRIDEPNKPLGFP